MTTKTGIRSTRKTHVPGLLVLTALVLSCGLLNGSSDMVLRSGTSFGECGGYCLHEIEVTSGGYTFTASSWSPEDPTQTWTASVTPTEWRALVSAVDERTLSTLDERYGCPDCADGGAEWIEVEDGDFHKRIEFEYGDTIEGAENLILCLRALRTKARKAAE